MAKLNTGWFTFSGRATRREYWGKTILAYLIIFFIALPLCFAPLLFPREGSEILTIIGLIVLFFTSLSIWPLTVRRLHDQNMSGWWLLWFFLLSMIPFAGWVVPIIELVMIWFVGGTPMANLYGPNPRDAD